MEEVRTSSCLCSVYNQMKEPEQGAVDIISPGHRKMPVVPSHSMVARYRRGAYGGRPSHGMLHEYGWGRRNEDQGKSIIYLLF